MTAHMPPADLVAEIRDLRRRLRDLERAAGLESASIGTGGLRVVDGGKIDIVDSGGNVTLSLSATQLLLAGLLSVTGTLDVDGALNVSGPTTLDGALDVVSGGVITVDGGQLVVKDSGGATVLTLATSGITLEGLLTLVSGSDLRVEDGGTITVQDSLGNDRIILNGSAGAIEVLNEGTIVWDDENGNERFKVGNTPVAGVDAIRIEYSDESGTGRAAFGEIRDEADGSLRGHGILIEDSTGGDVAQFVEGQAYIVANPDGGYVYLSTVDPDEVVLYDDAGNLRTVVGAIYASGGGSVNGFGFQTVNASGASIAEISDDEIHLAKPDGSTTILRINNTDGLRLNVDTDSDGMQSGKVTAGPTDSAGTGFRTLRIPN